MRRLFSLTNSVSDFQKIASSSQSISRFHAALLRSNSNKDNRKAIEVKIHYRAHNQTAKIDVHEFTKKGHKDKHYHLENISKEMNEKMKQMISGAHWGQFFAAVTKHRIKED